MYQEAELRYEEHGDWQALAAYFAKRIDRYDFWRDFSIWKVIPVLASALKRFNETGRTGLTQIDHEGVASLLAIVRPTGILRRMPRPELARSFSNVLRSSTSGGNWPCYLGYTRIFAESGSCQHTSGTCLQCWIGRRKVKASASELGPRERRKALRASAAS
jgi:hypothetical protein